MKKLALLKASVVLAALGLMPMSAFAGDSGWGGGWGESAWASAGAGGTAQSFVDAYHDHTFANTDANVLTRTDTRPLYGAAVADVSQEAGFYGKDRTYLEAGTYMDAGTSVTAEVGRRGAHASTSTRGSVYAMGEAFGDHSRIEAMGYGSSEQGSVALDTGRHEMAKGDAQQLSMGSISGTASGGSSAGVSVGVSATAEASADVGSSYSDNDN